MIVLPMILMFLLGLGVGIWIAAPAIREWAKGHLIEKPKEKQMGGRDVGIIVSGSAGTGKSTIATLIQQYLKTLGFKGVNIRLTDNQMPACPTDLRKRTASLIDAGTQVNVVEKMTLRSA